MCIRDSYKKHGTNPFSSCLPILIQMPIFFSLFAVLRNAAGAVGSGGDGTGKPGIGMMNQEMTDSFNQATIFGAPLKMTFTQGWESGNWVVVILLGIIMLLMIASQSVSYTHLDVYKRQRINSSSVMESSNNVNRYSQLIPQLRSQGAKRGRKRPMPCKQKPLKRLRSR